MSVTTSPIVKKIPFSLMMNDNDSLVGDFYFLETTEKLPIVILIHGFTGSKDWGFLPFLAENLAQNHFLAITFNFSYDGIAKDKDWVDDTDKFARNTITREVADLEYLVKSLQNKSILPQFICDYIDTDTIFLIGQSLGGAIATIWTAQTQIPSKVILLGSVGKLNRYSKRQIEDWKRTGFFEFNNLRNGQTLRINFSYIEDIEQNGYDLYKFLKKIHCPVLIIHGSEDYTVPLKEIESFYKKGQNPFVILEVIPNTGHTFGIDHPFIEPTPAFSNVLQKIIKFLK